jgi:hypothetical protein
MIITNIIEKAKARELHLKEKMMSRINLHNVHHPHRISQITIKNAQKGKT